MHILIITSLFLIYHNFQLIIKYRSLYISSTTPQYCQVCIYIISFYPLSCERHWVLTFCTANRGSVPIQMRRWAERSIRFTGRRSVSSRVVFVIASCLFVPCLRIKPGKNRRDNTSVWLRKSCVRSCACVCAGKLRIRHMHLWNFIFRISWTFK